jgi:hypothetical protein
MMIVKLHSQRLQTLDEVRAFLVGSGPLDFKVPARDKAYEWIENTLRQLGYKPLGKAEKCLVRDFLIKVSGFPRAQVTCLIHPFRQTGPGSGITGANPPMPFPGTTRRPISVSWLNTWTLSTRVIWTASRGFTT